MKRWLSLLLICLGFWQTTVILAQEASPTAYVLDAEGPVTVAMRDYIERGLNEARLNGVEVLIVQLDTPGGQVDLTQQIVQLLLNAEVPVVIYVAPSGAFAASAGTFITLAGHVAAMAPQTSIGAASPVQMQGDGLDETMQAKVENILIADIEGLAERRGEAAVNWARETISEARAAGATEALELGVIDVIATDIPDLLTQIDGLSVDVQGEPHELRTRNARIIPFEKTIPEQFLSILLRPEVALILMAIAVPAILIELYAPGGYVSGILGVVSLMLGLYALGQLPVNFVGVGLILVAFVIFALEVFTPTNGILSLAGVITFVLGAFLMFNTAGFNYEVPFGTLIGIAVSLGGFFLFIAAKAADTFRQQPHTGREHLAISTGVAKTELDPEGIVFADGTRWRATALDGSIEAGVTVDIVAVDGLHLKVRRKIG